MTLQELITLLENKLSFTQAQKTAAEQRGDIEMVEKTSADIICTETTLNQLRGLLQTSCIKVNKQ